MDLATYLKERRALVDDELARVLDLSNDLFGLQIESMRYSVFAGGKRVRPILALAASEAVGGSIAEAMPVACALELAHTYTLIHDDLPCMDDDDFRRGRPSNHKVFGEAQALLAGCSLLTLAFEIVSNQAREGGISFERAVRAIHVLAGAVGWQGVVGGQSIDIASTRKALDLSQVKAICRHKTATLISASVTAGATAGGATPEQIEALARYGLAIGLAFQVADDILNVEGDEKKLGKGTGTDAAAGKTTFPALLGMDKAKEYARELLSDALAALESFDAKAEPLRLLADYIVTRDR